ncbi:unnamed protein product [Cochlearia groenlandica]
MDLSPAPIFEEVIPRLTMRTESPFSYYNNRGRGQSYGRSSYTRAGLVIQPEAEVSIKIFLLQLVLHMGMIIDPFVKSVTSLNILHYVVGIDSTTIISLKTCLMPLQLCGSLISQIKLAKSGIQAHEPMHT